MRTSARWEPQGLGARPVSPVRWGHLARGVPRVQWVRLAQQGLPVFKGPQAFRVQVVFLAQLAHPVLMEQPVKLARQEQLVLPARTERAPRALPVLRAVWERLAQPVLKEQPARLELSVLRVRQAHKVRLALLAPPAQLAFKV